MRALTFGLALPLSGFLCAMSYLSSDERGGALWGAVSVACVLSLHFLPAITSGRAWGIRAIGGLVFALLFGVVATQHTAFFLQRESEAGKQRAETIKPEALPTLPRNSASVAYELSQASKAARWLKGGALEKQGRIVAALQMELEAVQQLEKSTMQQQEKQQQRQDAAMLDLLHGTITKVIGLDSVSVSLALNVTTALALELLASLLWFVALHREPTREWWMLPKGQAAPKTAGLFGSLLAYWHKPKGKPKAHRNAATTAKPAAQGKANPFPLPTDNHKEKEALPIDQVATVPPVTTCQEEELPSLDDAARLLTWLRKRGEPVTFRQCLSSSPIRKKERLQPVLDDLISRGLAKLEDGVLMA